jgi:hypothetical protein
LHKRRAGNILDRRTEKYIIEGIIVPYVTVEAA